MNAPGVYLIRSPLGETYVGASKVSVLERLGAHQRDAYKARQKDAEERSPLEREYAACGEQGFKFPRDWSVVVLDSDPAQETEWIYALQPSLNRRKRLRIPEDDAARLLLGVLGIDQDEARAVYRQGPLSVGQREARATLDRRVLALHRAGANLAFLGRVMGFSVKPNGSCRPLEHALERARGEEEATP